MALVDISTAPIAGVSRMPYGASTPAACGEAITMKTITANTGLIQRLPRKAGMLKPSSSCCGF
jgi:hypothetical protein